MQYQVEVIVHMQVLVTVEAEDEKIARNMAGMKAKSELRCIPSDIIDLTITDTYINQ